MEVLLEEGDILAALNSSLKRHQAEKVPKSRFFGHN